MAEFKEYLDKMSSRLDLVNSLFKNQEIVLVLDKLRKSKQTDHEMVFFSGEKSKQETGMFIFGSNFYACELNEQEFKQKLGLNSLNFRILNTYKKLKETQKKIKVSDILNGLQDKKKDSAQLDIYIRRILTLAYYLNWKLTPDKKDIEGDYIIEIPDKFLFKLKQRFNFDQICSVYENQDLFLFLNVRGKLNLVFKNKDKFAKEDIIKYVLPVLRKIFQIKSIRIN